LPQTITFRSPLSMLHTIARHNPASDADLALAAYCQPGGIGFGRLPFHIGSINLRIPKKTQGRTSRSCIDQGQPVRTPPEALTLLRSAVA